MPLSTIFVLYLEKLHKEQNLENKKAVVLGLDPIFIKNTTATLRNLQTLETDTESAIKLTPVGQEFYRDRSVPEALETQTIYAIAQPFGKIVKSSPIKSEKIDHLSNLKDYDESVYKVTILEQVQQAYEFYARRFEAKAEELWNNALKNKNVELATQALYLWGALGME